VLAIETALADCERIAKERMHTRGYLDPGDFHFVHDSRVRSREELIPQWTPGDRVVVVAPDPADALVATGGLLLALTCAFYQRPAAHRPDFYDYPSHFVIGGEAAAEPRLLGPGEQQPWSEAWCELDVWPNTHHAVAAPSPASLLQAAFMLEPTRLIWPADLAVPNHYAPPEGTVNPDQTDMRRLLRNRLRQVLLWSRDDISSQSWRLGLAHRPRKLVAEAAALLPADLRVSDTDTTRSTFRSVAIDDFL
jgi:hypothetical protein